MRFTRSRCSSHSTPGGATALRRLSTMLLVAVLAACHGDHLSPTDLDLDLFTFRIDTVSGDLQVGAPGEVLAPLVVRVTDEDGHPVRGHAVFWRITRGAGELRPADDDCNCEAVTATDHQGLSEVRWRLGPQPGDQEVEARALFSENRVFFLATSRSAP